MAEALSTPGLVRFGVFELDRLTGELRKAGVRLSLQEQPLQVLAVLLDRPGALVTREELRDRLWAADTFVDFEQGLNAAVKRLRHVLGDSADTPRFIETLPRRGYRFIAPVDGFPAAAPDAAALSAPSAASRAGARWARPALWAGAAAVAAGGLLAALGLKEPARTPKVVPLTSLEGREREPALSPDGRQVAFFWTGKGRPGLYVMPVSGGDPVLVGGGSPEGPGGEPGSGAVYSPAWSPDGNEIAFLRHTPGDQDHEIVVIPARGGRERRLGTTSGWQHGLSWSPDGAMLAFVGRHSPDGPETPDTIGLFDLRTGQRRRLTHPPPGSDEWSPSFSPDGHALAFVRVEPTSGRYNVYVQPLPDGPLRQRTFDEMALAVAWTPDGSSIIYSNDERRPLASLKIVPSTEGAPSPLGFGEEARQLSAARTANRLAYERHARDQNLWRIDGPASRDRNPPVRLVQSTREEGMPEFSPDGTRMLFASRQSGRRQLRVCDADGDRCSDFRTAVEVDIGGGAKWSPDGSRIAFSGYDGTTGNIDVYVLSVASGFAERMTDHPNLDWFPSWSRDGRWIYFGSVRDGVFRIWRMPAGGGPAVRFAGQGTTARESPDGRWLYYSVRGTGTGRLGQIWRVLVAGGQEPQLVVEGFVSENNWTVWRDSVLTLTEPQPGVLEFETFDPETRRRAEVASVRALQLGDQGGLTVSPDGRWIVYGLTDDWTTDLFLVEDLPSPSRSLRDLLFLRDWRW